MAEISADDNIMVGESDILVCECAKLSKFLMEKLYASTKFCCVLQSL